MKQIIMIGKPLSHVRSPYLLRDLIRTEGRDVDVTTDELGSEDLPGFMTSLRARHDVLGLIVTTPLKALARAYADRATSDVQFIGAANCIRCDGDDWLAANFDGYGFASAIAGSVAERTRPRVLLIGCGAAGSAIATSLVAAADLELMIFDADASKAEAFSARLQAFAPASHVVAVARPMDADIAINASTAGMARDDQSPVPDKVLRNARVIGDIVIGDTALKRKAQALGKTLIDGEAMVRGQVLFLYRFLTSNAQSESEVLALCGGND